MLKDTKICFIGGGAMATAMIAGLIEEQLIDPGNVTVSDPFAEQLERLSGQYPVNTTHNNVEAVSGKDIIILSIKPQTLPAVGRELQGHILAKALVLSIIAGAQIGNISQLLDHNRVVRVMPNTPAQVGKGMSVWMCTAGVSETQQAYAKTILEALGQQVLVEDEKYLDMATALSGSGPAYVFLFMEAMIDAGVHMGFSRPVAQQLVYQTIEGSVAFARESKNHPAILRNMVTSPGGTTADAIYQLEKGGFRTVLSKAIWAAYKKSRYLGGLKTDG